MNLIGLAQEVEQRLATVDKPVKVAVMGCVVNGPAKPPMPISGWLAERARGLFSPMVKSSAKCKSRKLFLPLWRSWRTYDPDSRMSNLYAPTLKEDPSDADIDSARLLLRAGMLRKAASGLYTFLPLGFRVLKKIENIVREEMDASALRRSSCPCCSRRSCGRRAAV